MPHPVACGDTFAHGGDDGILQSAAHMHQHEPGEMETVGLDPSLLELMGRAMAAL